MTCGKANISNRGVRQLIAAGMIYSLQYLVKSGLKKEGKSEMFPINQPNCC